MEEKCINNHPRLVFLFAKWFFPSTEQQGFRDEFALLFIQSDKCIVRSLVKNPCSIHNFFLARSSTCFHIFLFDLFCSCFSLFVSVFFLSPLIHISQVDDFSFMLWDLMVFYVKQRVLYTYTSACFPSLNEKCFFFYLQHFYRVFKETFGVSVRKNDCNFPKWC